MTDLTSFRYPEVVAVLDSDTPPRWQVAVMESLRSLEGLRLRTVVLVRDRRPSGTDLRSDGNGSGRGPWNRFVARSVARAEATRRGELPAALRPLQAESVATDGVLLDLTDGTRWSDAELEEVKERWVFRHGTGPRPGLGEFVEGAPLTRTTLETAPGADGGSARVLAEAVLATVPHSYSSQVDSVLLGTTCLAAMAVRATPRRGTDGGFAPARSPDASGGPDDVFEPPPLGRFLTTLAGRWVRRQWKGVAQADRWHVGLVDRPVHTFLEEPSLEGVRWFDPPAGSDRYVADPFGVPVDDGLAVLVEDYDHRTRHGVISGYRVHVPPAGGTPQVAGQPRPVVSLPGHTSFPYLFEHSGQWWCVPETLTVGDVSLFRFDPEQLELRFESVLLEGVSLADPIVFEWNERWWLLGTDATSGANSHLRAWHASDPLGEWTPHRVDPLAIDVRRARNAGTPFVHRGSLHRPTQDCVSSYGGAINVMRIDVLDPDSFEEELAVVVEPDPRGAFPDGAHTLSGVGERTLVDGTRRRFSPSSFRHELRTRLRKVADRAPRTE